MVRPNIVLSRFICTSYINISIGLYCRQVVSSKVKKVDYSVQYMHTKNLYI